MTDTKHHESEGASLQGRLFRPQTSAELAEAVEQAFDYRGDVTLRLGTGTAVTGYIFNRGTIGGHAYLEILVEGEASPRQVDYRDIRELVFSGEDTASGKSWDVWVAKKESQRAVEAAQVASEARARGHL